MPTLGEINIYRVWAAKQSAKGTSATSATRSFKQVAGTVVAAIASGTENFSDGTSFGDTTTWLDSITGTGTPGIEGTTDELAWLLWMFHGTESVTVTGTNAIATLTMTGTPTGGASALVYDGRTTGTVPFNATAGAVDVALEALPNLGVGQLTAAGGPWPNTPITVTMDGPATQKRPHPNFTISPANNTLSGGVTPTWASVMGTPGVNATHQTLAGGTAGFWMTWWQTVGQATIQRLKMNDGRISSLTIEASTGTKALRVTPNLMFVDPAEVYTVDPTPGMPVAPVMIYTEGAGAFTVDGTVFTGQTQFQITLNLNLSFVYGDDVVPFDLSRGAVGATLAASMLFDDTMLAKWNTWLYGIAAPTTGTKPIKRIPPVGSYSCNLVKKDSAGNTIGTFNASFPGVQWDLPDSPGPNPDQGSVEVALSGRLQKLPGITTLYTFNVGCQQPAFTG